VKTRLPAAQIWRRKTTAQIKVEFLGFLAPVWNILPNIAAARSENSDETQLIDGAIKRTY